MKRREFIALIAGAAVAWPLTARPQHPANIHRIGLLGDASWEPLRQSLRDLGYVEGQTITLESRSSEGQSERWSDLATELVQLNVDIIVTRGTPATLAARTATTTIPIVMEGVGAPIKTGLILSLARPGGNVTGLGQLGAELASKRLELLKETLPNISRVAFLWNSENPDQKFHLDEVQAAARALGMTLQSVEVRSREELERAFATMRRERPWNAPNSCNFRLTSLMSSSALRKASSQSGVFSSSWPLTLMMRSPLNEFARLRRSTHKRISWNIALNGTMSYRHHFSNDGRIGTKGIKN